MGFCVSNRGRRIRSSTLANRYATLPTLVHCFMTLSRQWGWLSKVSEGRLVLPTYSLTDTKEDRGAIVDLMGSENERKRPLDFQTSMRIVEAMRIAVCGRLG